MTACVCGCSVFEHVVWNGAGVGCQRCSCSTFLPDDGTDPAPLAVRMESYSGQYKGPYRLDGETA